LAQNSGCKKSVVNSPNGMGICLNSTIEQKSFVLKKNKSVDGYTSEVEESLPSI
jgi:hypothetical protein